VLYSSSTPRLSTSGGGTTIQPSRQPVIRQALEKLLVLISRSPAPANGRNEGAERAAPKLSRS
jgi:hypothetical protein